MGRAVGFSAVANARHRPASLRAAPSLYDVANEALVAHRTSGDHSGADPTMLARRITGVVWTRLVLPLDNSQEGFSVLLTSKALY